MPIVFSAIVPHTPILIPSVGKTNTERLRATISAYEKLEHDLYAAQPDTLIIITPHGPIQPESFTMNLNPEFDCNFEEFGDFTTKFTVNGDVGLSYKIRERLETRSKVQLISEKKIDYGSAVPLYLLARHLPKIKVMPVYYSGMDLNFHYNFGQLLKREILINRERIAVIASGELSHRLSKDSPAGYSAKGKKFDKKLIEYLSKNQVEEILKITPELSVEAGECGLKSIVTLLGIMDGIKYTPQQLSYESPFGIGYLVMNFKL